MNRLYLAFWAALLWLAWTAPVAAQGTPGSMVSEAAVTYEFGRQITFQAHLQTDQGIQSVHVLVQAEGDPQTIVLPAQASGLQPGEYALQAVQDVAAQPLRAFSQVSFQFEVLLADGASVLSKAQSFNYTDNRFEWQARERGPFSLHWRQGDIAFAQQALDTAQAGLERVQSLLTVAAPQHIDIYVYPSSAELQETLLRPSENRVAGHADPDLEVMVVALPAGPDQQLLMEQRIPHELSHIMLYQATGAGYAHLPTWLNEGLASVAELYPNPDYQILLNDAFQRDALLPVSSLCQAFPRDASSALLAYAEAAAFTRYLQATYGSQGIAALIAQYADGMSCEQGAVSALGAPLAQVERAWRQAHFGEDPLRTAVRNLGPWFVLLVAALGAPLILAVNAARRRGAAL